MTSKQKRLIIGLGGKGGTGKTLHFCLLYYTLISTGVKVMGFDADTENPDFCRYHAKTPHPVGLLNILDTGDAKELFTIMADQQPDVVLVDMPGASGNATRNQLEEFGAFDIAAALDYQITFDTVLNNQRNAIVSLKTMFDYGKDRANFVAVKNLIWSQSKTLNFDRWEQSETRKQFLEMNGAEIEMAALSATCIDEMHESCTSFFDAAELRFGDVILISSFLRKSQTELYKAAEYLGLEFSTSEPIDLLKQRKRAEG